MRAQQWAWILCRIQPEVIATNAFILNKLICHKHFGNESVYVCVRCAYWNYIGVEFPRRMHRPCDRRWTHFEPFGIQSLNRIDGNFQWFYAGVFLQPCIMVSSVNGLFCFCVWKNKNERDYWLCWKSRNVGTLACASCWKTHHQYSIG